MISMDANEKTGCALEDILTCMLDFEPRKDPKVLHCGHTFCQGCLEKLSSMGRHQDPTHLSCPLCNQLTPIPNGRIQELPDNFTILQLRDMGKAVVKDLQLYQDKENVVDCDSCSGPVDKPRESKTARYFCYKCSEHYCKDCYTKHQSSFKDHNEVVDLQSTVRDMLQVYCVKHHKHMKYYCQQCTQALCTVCRLNDHPKDHWIVDIADKETIIEKRAQIRKLHPTVTENLNEATRRSNLLQDVRRALYESYADMEHELLDTFRKLKEAVLKQLDTLYEQLEIERVQRRTVFEKHLDITQEDLNFHVSSCQSLDGFVEHILHEDNQFQPLSLYSDLCARMSTLDRFMPEIEHINTMPVALFVQNDKFLGSMPAPGWWDNERVTLSFEDNEIALKPHPSVKQKQLLISRSLSPRPKGAFFDDDMHFVVPCSKNKSSLSVSLDALETFCSPSHPSDFSSLEMLSVSRSANDCSLLSDEGKGLFDLGLKVKASPMPNKESKSPIQTSVVNVNIKSKKRSSSETAIFYTSADTDEKLSAKAGRAASYPKSSFLPSFLRRSIGKAKRKKVKEVVLPEVIKQVDQDPQVSQQLDSYSLLWHSAGEVGRRLSLSKYSLGYITDACYGPDDSWYLADHTSCKVASYDAQTANRKELFSVASSSFRPWSLTVAGNSNSLQVHCTDVGNRCIQVFVCNDSENLTASNYSWGHRELFKPHGICSMHSRDTIVVSDLSPTSPTLLVADTSGTVISRVSNKYGNGDSQLKYPWYITSDDYGRIYVSDRDNSAVKVFDVTGQFLTKFKHRLGCPAGIAVDSRGHIIVADRSGNHNIAIFTPDGQFVGNLNMTGDLSWPQAVACDHNNTVMVTEYLENSLSPRMFGGGCNCTSLAFYRNVL